MDIDTATKIAEEYLEKIALDSSFPIRILKHHTLERDFGWVFFWGPDDPSVLLAGNAPLIVDRRDGSVHATGTAYPTEQYMESYARVGRTYPFAVPGHIVILEGWRRGMLKISLTKLIQRAAGKGLAEAKHCTDEVCEGRTVELSFSTEEEAEAFRTEAESYGVVVRRETRYH